jgi:glyoxylase-like metal-dependent hydrolase (beta-lactamase superfamily II)
MKSYSLLSTTNNVSTARLMNNNETVQVTRRHFLTSAGLAAASFCLAPHCRSAEQSNPVTASREAAASASITVQRMRGGVSVLTGSGGNIAVLSSGDGKILVDAGIAQSRPGIAKALAEISLDPVRHVVNTHWHYDHTDGNEWLNSVGAKIVAHENTRKCLSVATRVDAWNFTFPPTPKSALPTDVFQQEHRLHLNGETLVLKYYGPSHTDSDISVEFTHAEILHTGDTWWNGHYPFIDYSTGGSIDGAISAAGVNVARVSDNTLVIPGHGPIGGKSDLIEFREMLTNTRGKVAALKKQGKSLDEVLAEAPTAEYDTKWGGFFIDGKTFTALVYAGV